MGKGPPFPIACINRRTAGKYLPYRRDFMSTTVNRFFESLQGKHVAFIGIGVTNTDTIKLFARKGVRVTACDKRSREQLGAICDEYEALGVSLRLGEHYLDTLDFDVIMRTPGMYFGHPKLVEARKKGIAVTSEMEVFFDLCPAKLFAVTGSDGKTTTTSVIAKMLETAGKRVFLGGNIGRALLPLIDEITSDDYAVVELSSFQLISMRKSPDVAVITNIAPNHLDVHKDMQEYIDCKKNVLLHQNAFSRAVLNCDNEITDGLSPLVRGELLQFGRKSQPANGAWLDGEGYLVMRYYGETTRLLHRDEIRIPGIHNVENYLAAISAVWGVVPPAVIREVARTFPGVEHRIEFVRELCGVKWYNDSIATSPTRTIAGLHSFDQKLIIIAGGYDKKIPFTPLGPVMVDKVKILILMGVTADKIEQTVRSTPGFDECGMQILHVSGMEEAVQAARDAAKPGDIVSLSPACASFDLYRNFELRGQHYKALVNAL